MRLNRGDRTGDVVAENGDYALTQIGNVDYSALLEGADADKPAAGTAGRYYWATDTNILYRDNGTTWTAKAGRGSEDTPVPGTTHMESLSVEDALADYQPNSGVTPYASPELQAQKRQPTPRFTRSSNNPIHTASDASWSISSNEIIWPDILPTDNLSDPLGELYMYYAPHDTDGGGVAYADDPEGPWTDYSGNPLPISSTTSGAEMGVFWHEGHQEVWLYVNESNSAISLYRSPDGLTNWDSGTQVLSFSNGHVGYPRVFRTPSGVYMTTWQKENADKSKIVLRHSDDGINNWSWIQPSFQGSAPTGTGDGITTSGGDWYHGGTALLPFSGGYLCFWTRQNKTDGYYNIHWGYTDDGVTIQDWGAVIEGGGQSWEDSKVYCPCPAWHDDRLCLFYVGGSNAKIGVAVADFSEVRA